MSKPLPYFIPLGLTNHRGGVACVIYCCFSLKAIEIPLNQLNTGLLMTYLPTQEWDNKQDIREQVKVLKKECYEKGFIAEEFIHYINNINYQVFYNKVFTPVIKKHLAHTIIILKSMFFGEHRLIDWRYDKVNTRIIIDKKLCLFNRIKRISREVKADENSIYIPASLIRELANTYHLDLPTTIK